MVLVVEDEPVQRLTLVDILTDGGFEVVDAFDAASAVEILESRTDIRLVVSDIDMPGAMDGLKLAASVRQRWPPIEILLLSAGSAPRTEDLPARVEFISKPIITDRLLAKVQALAEAYKPYA